MANAKPASDNTVMRGRPNAKRQKNPAGTKSPKFSNQGRVMLNASDHSAESVSQVVVRAPFPHEESSSIRPKRVTARIKPIAVVQAKASEKRCEGARPRLSPPTKRQRLLEPSQGSRSGQWSESHHDLRVLRIAGRRWRKLIGFQNRRWRSSLWSQHTTARVR